MKEPAFVLRKAAALALLATPLAFGATTVVAEDVSAPSFAVVDGTVITVQEVESALSGAISQKFYHRRPREEQLAALRQEVSEGLVNRVLLVKEASRRGIAVDSDKVSADLSAYKRRIRDASQWERLLPELTRALEEKNIVSQLEATTRSVADPDAAQIERYYATHANLFTEPEQFRVSVILLRVDPSSPRETWDATAAQAEALVERLGQGEDFAALARAHSQDDTAAKGGDVGYLHRGMLAQNVEDLLDKMEVGSVSEPVRILEGVGVFRLADRRAPRLKPIDAVRERVIEMWQREQGEQRWQDLIAALRAKSEITMDPQYAERSGNGLRPEQPH